MRLSFSFFVSFFIMVTNTSPDFTADTSATLAAILTTATFLDSDGSCACPVSSSSLNSDASADGPTLGKLSGKSSFSSFLDSLDAAAGGWGVTVLF